MVSRRVKARIVWRRTGLLRLSVVVVSALLLGWLLYCLRDEDSGASTDLLVWSVVNLNIVVLGALAFLIGRDIVKLVFDSKHKVIGSKLRRRLVAAFVGLTLVPTVIIFVLASGMVNKAMSGWFNNQVDSAYRNSLAVARHYYEPLRDNVNYVVTEVATELTSKPLIYQDKITLRNYLEESRKKGQLFSLAIYNANAEQISLVQNAAAHLADFTEPELDSADLQQVLTGNSFDKLEKVGAAQFVSIFYPLTYAGEKAVLVARHRMSPEMAYALMEINDSYKEYEQLKLFRTPIRSGYLLTLSMITGMILFSAIWIGFYLAREITVPLQRLAEGTRAVARGNYDFRLKASGDDEIGLLVKSFNTMTADLKSSRSDAEDRRLYLEAILAKLAAAVIAVDLNKNILSINQAAERLFARENLKDSETHHLSDILGPHELQEVEGLLENLKTGDGSAIEREMDIVVNGRVRKIITTAGSIADSTGAIYGSVLLFDDVTDLVKAQQSAAWREVARRIAHEIKNPLTPIQLSAQRIQKILKGSPFEEKTQEATQVILEHVKSIKRLTDEFAKFARMPPVEMRPANLNALIFDVLGGFVDQHPDAFFQFVSDSTIPEVLIDKEQIRRILINLLDNALAACEDNVKRDHDKCPRIIIKTGNNSARGVVTMEVIDNGSGISESDRGRIFEPYMTTKAGGTGLGLAIVASVVAEHHGEIKVFNNEPYGARFVIELRVHSEGTTQRRLSKK